MNETLLQASLIALWGMGFVFASLLIVWILITLVNFIGNSLRSNAAENQAELERKHKAAALAVAYNLKIAEQPAPKPFPLPPTAIVSAWQLSMRTLQMKKNHDR